MDEEIIKESAADAVKLINKAAEQAAIVIASAAQSASRLVASNAADANRVLINTNGNDHDLLVELKVRIEGIRGDIKNLSDGTQRRIDTLEREKLNVSDSYNTLYKAALDKVLLDIDSRVRFIEKRITQITTYGTVFLILLGIAEYFVGKLIH